MSPMSEARAKLYINTGVVTGKSDMYNILRPLLKQTVSYTYHRGARIESSGTGWVERIVVDHPDVASYFTPLAICLNLDSFDYLQFDTTSEQLLVYTLTIGAERVVLEFAAAGQPRLGAELDLEAAATARADRCRATPKSSPATCASSRWSCSCPPTRRRPTETARTRTRTGRDGLAGSRPARDRHPPGHIGARCCRAACAS